VNESCEPTQGDGAHERPRAEQNSLRNTSLVPRETGAAATSSRSARRAAFRAGNVRQPLGAGRKARASSRRSSARSVGTRSAAGTAPQHTWSNSARATPPRSGMATTEGRKPSAQRSRGRTGRSSTGRAQVDPATSRRPDGRGAATSRHPPGKGRRTPRSGPIHHPPHRHSYDLGRGRRDSTARIGSWLGAGRD
jgi:hypothetical protein